jgi:hypothetical protein
MPTSAPKSTFLGTACAAVFVLTAFDLGRDRPGQGRRIEDPRLVESVGATGLVVMRPVDVNHATAATMSNSSNDMYGGYWGGYYGIGWADPWVEKAPDTRVDIIITVETLVFSLPQNKLVWTGTSQTTNPKNAEKLVHQLATEAARELERLGLLAP